MRMHSAAVSARIDNRSGLLYLVYLYKALEKRNDSTKNRTISGDLIIT